MEHIWAWVRPLPILEGLDRCPQTLPQRMLTFLGSSLLCSHWCISSWDTEKVTWACPWQLCVEWEMRERKAEVRKVWTEPLEGRYRSERVRCGLQGTSDRTETGRFRCKQLRLWVLMLWGDRNGTDRWKMEETGCLETGVSKAIIFSPGPLVSMKFFLVKN